MVPHVYHPESIKILPNWGVDFDGFGGVGVNDVRKCTNNYYWLYLLPPEETRDGWFIKIDY